MNALTLKNLLREIKRTFTKFLSIFAICALGVAFFAGIRATSPDMKEAGDRLYNTYNLSEIPLVFFLYFNLTAYHCKSINDSRKVFRKIELIILRKQ